MSKDKICFKLDTPEKVEYANAHKNDNNKNCDYSNPAIAGQFFHLPGFNCDRFHFHPTAQPGYTPVDDIFEEKYYKPWYEGQLPLSCEDEEMVCERNEQKDEGKVEPCTHEPLIDTGIGYYHCPACNEGWTYDEWKKGKVEPKDDVLEILAKKLTASLKENYRLKQFAAYLKRNVKDMPFTIATHDYENGNHWYIHPEGKPGETFDLYLNETPKPEPHSAEGIVPNEDFLAQNLPYYKKDKENDACVAGAIFVCNYVKKRLEEYAKQKQ